MNSDSYFMNMAILSSLRATCARRRVGAVFVNKRKHVIATGYNGTAAGQTHCIESSCAGAKCKSGEGLDLCEAIHAEQNALLQCRDVHDIYAAYVTASPCIHCVKLLLNTSCQRIVFAEQYTHGQSEAIWLRAGRIWEKWNGSEEELTRRRYSNAVVRAGVHVETPNDFPGII